MVIEMTDIETPEGFTRWDGRSGEARRPILQIAFRTGEVVTTTDPAAYLWTWGPADDPSDIIAYRVLP